MPWDWNGRGRVTRGWVQGTPWACQSHRRGCDGDGSRGAATRRGPAVRAVTPGARRHPEGGAGTAPADSRMSPALEVLDVPCWGVPRHHGRAGARRVASIAVTLMRCTRALDLRILGLLKGRGRMALPQTGAPYAAAVSAYRPGREGPFPPSRVAPYVSSDRHRPGRVDPRWLLALMQSVSGARASCRDASRVRGECPWGSPGRVSRIGRSRIGGGAGPAELVRS